MRNEYRNYLSRWNQVGVLLPACQTRLFLDSVLYFNFLPDMVNGKCLSLPETAWQDISVFLIR